MTSSNRYSAVPDSKLAKELTVINRTPSPNCSSLIPRASIMGCAYRPAENLTFDRELLYVGAMFTTLA